MAVKASVMQHLQYGINCLWEFTIARCLPLSRGSLIFDFNLSHIETQLVLHFVLYCMTVFLSFVPHVSFASRIRHTHIRLMALCPGLPRWAGTRKVEPIWTLLKQETVSGSGISWAVCKSAPRSRQITTPAPHHSFFTGLMPFLPPNQQCQSTEGTSYIRIAYIMPCQVDCLLHAV